MQQVILALMMAVAAAPGAPGQGPDTRSDAQVYMNAEHRLARAEEEAVCAWYPAILHRIIDLRTVLRPLARFADRNGDLTALRGAAPREEEQGICIGVSARTIEPWLREAQRDAALLQRRLRRSQWRDPNVWRPGG